MFWTNEKLSLIVAWLSSVFISRFKVQSSIGHLVWFFKSPNSIVSLANVWCPWKSFLKKCFFLPKSESPTNKQMNRLRQSIIYSCLFLKLEQTFDFLEGPFSNSMTLFPLGEYCFFSSFFVNFFKVHIKIFGAFL